MLLSALLLGLLALGGGAAYGVSWVISTANSAPNIDQLAPQIQGQVSEVYAADGTLLGYISANDRQIVILRRVLAQAQQPRLLRDATVAIEDRRFFQHGGVDYQGLIRAAFDDVFHGSTGTQGASTLTMQLVKNDYMPQKLVDSRSIRYKIVQAKLATQLANRRSKEWILTQYLNDITYGTVGGESAYGVGAASQMFFDQRHLNKLSLAQMALLAGLPQAPTSYNPFLYPAAARARRSEVLAAMVRSHYITADQAAAADAAPLGVHQNVSFTQVKQPYVFDYVRQKLVQALGQQTVNAGGLKVYTSINLQDQAYAEQALLANEGQPGDPQAALATVNPANGEIVAMAQNTTYGLKSGQTTENYVTQGLRQTGSAFKIFTLMTLIRNDNGDPNQTYYISKQLKAGWLPADPTWSVATAEKSYQGDINVTKATALSDNTVYAQLGADVGLNSLLSTAYQMGISTQQQPFYPDIIGGLSPGVTPLQMADAYATVASGGVHHTPTIINSVTLASGRNVSLVDPHPTQVFTDGQAYAGTQALKTVLQYGTAAGETWGCPAAGKTGTTNNYTDAYFVGYTPQLSTAVWVGYAASEREQMNDVNGLGPGYGGTLAAPIWKAFMEKASNGFCGDFPQPTNPFYGTAYAGAHSVSANAFTNTVATFTGPGTAVPPVRGTVTTRTAPATTATGTVTTPTAGTTTAPAGTVRQPTPTTPSPPAPGGGPPGKTTPSGGSGVN